MSEIKTKEKTKNKAFSIDFGVGETSTALKEATEEETESTRKYGFDVDNKEGTYKDIHNIKIDNLNEEERNAAQESVVSIKKDLFLNSEDDTAFNSKLTRLNMNIFSQVGDEYNNLSREIAMNTKIHSTEDIAKEINNLRDVVKDYDIKSVSLFKNPLDVFTNLFKKVKRDHEINTESIEDKISIIVEELKAKREEQKDLLIENDQKVNDLITFMKEISKTIFICRELLFSVEKKRIELADMVIEEGENSPMLISNYKDIYQQEKSLEVLIRNLLVVRLHLNTAFNKNSDMRSTFQSVSTTIDQVISFVIPSYRNLLIDYVQENKISDTIKLIEMVKSARDSVEKESNKNYQEIRLKSNNLANQSIYNIKTLAESVKIIIDTEEKLRADDARAKVLIADEIKAVNDLQKTLGEYSVGKDKVKTKR